MMTYYATSATANTLVTSSGTWVAWNNQGTAATTTVGSNVWTYWNTGSTTGTLSDVFRIWNQGLEGGSHTHTHTANPVPLTPEEREALRVVQEETQRKIQAQYAEREKKQLAAQKAALKLFLGLVGRKAYTSWKKRGYHEIIAHSGKRYRLAVHETIREMAGHFGDQVAARLCIHSSSEYRLPAEDVLVQQLLLLMAGEQGEALLHKTANRTVAA